MASVLHTYYTTKVVGIENKNLGVLYYTFVVLITSYVMYNIVASKGYLEYDSVVGAAEMKLKWAKGVIDTTQLEYCQSSAQATGQGCVLWDKYQVGLIRGDRSILIVTKVKEVLEQRVCPRTASSCAVPGIWKEVSKTNHFIAGVESTVLNLEHSFVAPLFYEESGHDRVYSRDNKEMAGVFIKGHGSNSSIIQKLLVGEIDRIPFPSLLAAAEIDSLDTPTQIFDDDGNKTLRESGFYLHLDIHYNNVRCDRSISCAFGTQQPTYRYRASMVPQEVHVTKIFSEDDDKGTRIRRVYYGMLVTVKQSGKIGRFSASALILQLVGGLGMLAISTAIVDTLATYALPDHRQFGVAKYSMKTLDPLDKKPDTLKASTRVKPTKVK